MKRLIYSDVEWNDVNIKNYFELENITFPLITEKGFDLFTEATNFYPFES